MEENKQYKFIILSILLKLGLNVSNKGTFYLRDMIIAAIQDKNITESNINLKYLREKLGKNKNIKTNIDYAFKNINILKAEKNFKTIFGFEYDRYYITAKSVISLIIDRIQK